MFTERKAIELRICQIQSQKVLISEKYPSLFDRLRQLDEKYTLRPEKKRNVPTIQEDYLFTERDAIYHRMNEMHEEILRLNDEYDSLFYRLRQLDEREILNRNIQTPIEPVFPVAQNTEAKSFKKVNEESLLPIDNNSSSSKVKKEPTEDIGEQGERQPKDEDNSLKEPTKPSYRSKELLSIVVSILKKHKVLKSMELQRILKEQYNIEKSSFTQFMNGLMKKDSSIIRPSNGRYSYKPKSLLEIEEEIRKEGEAK